MKHHISTALTACLILTALAAAPSFAAKSYKTTTTILPGKEGFEGKLSSSKSACLSNRLVRGQILAGGPPRPLGNVRADGSGRWKFKGEAAASRGDGARSISTGLGTESPYPTSDSM